MAQASSEEIDVTKRVHKVMVEVQENVGHVKLTY